MPGAVDPPFGRHALPAWLERLRRGGARLGAHGPARRITSLIRRACLAFRPDPVDVEPFPGQRARLYPRDNLSEKRVFAAPQFWDAAERAALAAAMKRVEGAFRFVDAGANVGLYTLALRSHGPIRALAIEPDPENRRRLAVNLAVSGAAGEVTVAPVALGAAAGRMTLGAAGRNRGEIALGSDAGPGETVAVRPLLDLVGEAGLDRVDALKIDIEGMEEPVLAAYFRDAPPRLRPALVVIEARRGETTPALALLGRVGYVLAGRTRMNAILAAPAAGWPEHKSEIRDHGET